MRTGTLTVKPKGGEPFDVRAGEFMRLDKSVNATLMWTEGAMEKAYMYFTKTGAAGSDRHGGCAHWLRGRRRMRRVPLLDQPRVLQPPGGTVTRDDDIVLCRLCFVKSDHATDAAWARYSFATALPLTAVERVQIQRMRAVARDVG